MVMMNKDESYHSLLMEYASGCLDEAHALVIATHMALSPAARKIVAQYESIGGSMLNDCCAPVAMKPDARKCVMDKLDKMVSEAKAASSCAKKNKSPSDYLEMPGCLEKYIEQTVWHQTSNGRQTIHIKTSCSGSKAQLVKTNPGEKIATQTTTTHEITLVLRGAVQDNNARYQRGDLFIAEDGTPHILIADSNEGCVCFVVHPSQSRVRRIIANFFKPFCK